jgi:hypothetical protein
VRFAFVCFALIFLVGCPGRPEQRDLREGSWANPIYVRAAPLFYAEYVKDEQKADAKYKGKVVNVGCGFDRSFRPKTDQLGKYLLGYTALPGVFRCYIREGKWLEEWGHGERSEVIGICSGMKDGEIVLEECKITLWGGQ